MFGFGAGVQACGGGSASQYCVMLTFAVAIDHQHVAGGKFLNAAKKRLRRGRRDKGQIVIKRFFVYFRASRPDVPGSP